MESGIRIRELVDILNKAGYAYYQESREIMSNFEYDRLYDELVELEKETGIVLSNSPTVNVGYEVLSELPKERHSAPMLSLDKTKDTDALAAFLGNNEGVLSWKLDGLTIVLTYNKGVLVKAVTRGNGAVGEVVTNNARVFDNIPVVIPYKGELTIRGEAVIRYSDFEKINKGIEDVGAKYKNPRNLCAGTVRQLNNEITAKRNVKFIAFALINADGVSFGNSVAKQFEWMKIQGFDVVEYRRVTAETVESAVQYFSESIKTNDFPSDGLVLMFDDIEYGISLGATSKFPRNGIAFKWADEQAETVLREIEWSPSRTGLINPVAIFDPVELEGTTVSRASVHNLSIMEQLELGIGDKITVFKANMIIPQIAGNLTRSRNIEIPSKCPACGGVVEVRQENGTKTLYCTNADCSAKHIKKYSHFVSRDAMNIEGLSEETLEKLIDMGFIKEYADIFKLDQYEDYIVNKKGFGKKSFDNLIKSINNARKIELSALIYSLGILNIGLSNAKIICKSFDYDVEKIRRATHEQLISIDGIGSVIADQFTDYFSVESNNVQFDNLLREIEIFRSRQNTGKQLADKVFVITGAVEHFANRKALKDFIEKRGGRATGSVTGNTDYLINNNPASASSKNKKARELGVKIITEEEFLQLVNKEAVDYAD